MTDHVSQPSLPFQRLDVYVAARELAALVHSHPSPAPNCAIRPPAPRSRASSPSRRGSRTRARASAGGTSPREGGLCEAVAALDLAVSIGAVAPARASAALALALRVNRMLGALRRPNARAA